MFALIDCNNFYASCERVFRPDLHQKPIVILSNNDGCVIARSYEARELGIPMGAPAFEFEEMFRRHHVHVFSSNFTLYGDMSNRVMRILEEFSPEAEVYSIDEIFLKFRGFARYDLEAYGQQMRSRVGSWTGIPISIGIAPTKALAKAANRVAKKFPERTGGVYLLDTEERRVKALKWLQIEDVWGIGRQHARRLRAQGIGTAYAFTQMPDAGVQRQMGIVGLRLKYDLSGTPALDLETPQPKQNIATTRSFEHNYTEYALLAERISTFAASCAQKLRQQNTCCNSICVFIRTNEHREDLPQYGRSLFMGLPYPTQSTIDLSRFATEVLRRIYKPGYAYKRAGVIVQDITPAAARQVCLFENSDPRHPALMRAMDALNTRYGSHKVRLASQDLKRVWKMRQEKLSPRYTTRLSDIISVHAGN